MSFKIPASFENLGLTEISDINRIKVGDVIVIPSYEDEPRLRVSLGTLRSWGLSVTSNDSVHRYGCSRYSAARNIFGASNNLLSWGTSDMPRLEKSHVMVVVDAYYDKNADFGKKRESTFTYENANSITQSKEVKEEPVYPIVSLCAIPFDMFPKYKDGEYPHVNDIRPNLKAYDILLESVGKGSIPTFTAKEVESCDGHPNLKYTMAILSCIHDHCSDEQSSLLNKSRLSHIGIAPYGRYGKRIGASEIIITAPNANGSSVEKEDHCKGYFHYDSYTANKSSLTMDQKFIKSIKKHGALFYHSDELTNTAARVFAQAIAAEMTNRYERLTENIESIIKGLSDELPKVKKILDNLKQSSENLKIDEKLESDIKKLF